MAERNLRNGEPCYLVDHASVSALLFWAINVDRFFEVYGYGLLERNVRDNRANHAKTIKEIFVSDWQEIDSAKVHVGDFEGDVSEYTFVYNPALIRKLKRYMAGACMLLLVLWVGIYFISPSFGERLISDPIPLVIGIGVAFFSPLLSLVYYSRLRIVINRQGISSSGFLFEMMPRHSAWSEFSQIRRTNDTLALGKPTQHMIVFIQRFGRQHLLRSHTQDEPFFVGVGHALTLQEAIEVFAGPVTELTEEERVKIPALTASVDLGREVGHVCYAALGLAIVAVIPMFFSDRPRLLDSPMQSPFYWAFGLSSCALACWYMRRIRNKAIMLIPSVMLGGAVALSLIPWMAYTSSWLGKEEQAVFRIIKDSDPVQRWQSVSDPEQTFSIYARPEQRVYREVGTQHAITIYHGPGALSAIPHHEYRALSLDRQ